MALSTSDWKDKLLQLGIPECEQLDAYAATFHENALNEELFHQLICTGWKVLIGWSFGPKHPIVLTLRFEALMSPKNTLQIFSELRSKVLTWGGDIRCE